MVKRKRYLIQSSGRDITDSIARDIPELTIEFNGDIVSGRGIVYKNGAMDILRPESIVLENADAVILDVEEFAVDRGLSYGIGA